MTAIKAELDNNMRIYKEDSVTLLNWSEYIDFLYEKSTSQGRTFEATEKEFEQIKSTRRDRFAETKLIKKLNDSVNLYGPFIIQLDVLPQVGISTDAWEAAKSQGVLTNLDNETMANLTRIYQVINQDLGVNDSEILKSLMVIELDGSFDGKSNSRLFKKISFIYKHKGKVIGKYYKNIKWGSI